MGIQIAIEHRTSYEFDRATTVHPHILRLRPAPHSRTPILSQSALKDIVAFQLDPEGGKAAPKPKRKAKPAQPIGELEKIILDCALEHTGGKRVEAARLLGLGRNTLTRKLKEIEGK